MLGGAAILGHATAELASTSFALNKSTECGEETPEVIRLELTECGFEVAIDGRRVQMQRDLAPTLHRHEIGRWPPEAAPCSVRVCNRHRVHHRQELAEFARGESPSLRTRPLSRA